MKTVSLQEVMELKFRDRNSIPELEYHADGACVHLGKISPACRVCFTGETGGGIQIGQECNCKCPECYYQRGRTDANNEPLHNAQEILTRFFRWGLDPNWKPRSYAYQSAGETLMYIDQLLPFAPIFNNYERIHNHKIYRYLYTNGVLLDEDMVQKVLYLGVNEIRFHCSASNFSDKVFRAMELAYQHGITVSVEEPSAPWRALKILSHLDTFQELNVKHLNMVEIQVTSHNKPDLDKFYLEGRMYKDHFYHLYDEGLVYEVMRERIRKGHTYSVLDCNSLVENHRHMKNARLGMNMDTITGMCSE